VWKRVSLTVPAVNSALQPAWATLATYQRSCADAYPGPGAGVGREPRRARDAAALHAGHEQGDPAALVAVLAEDARLTISPNGLCWGGREEISPPFLDDMGALGHWRCVATAADRQLAAAMECAAGARTTARRSRSWCAASRTANSVALDTFVRRRDSNVLTRRPVGSVFTNVQPGGS